MQKKHVVVLKGGLSKEKEVSLKSGEAVIKSLKSLGYKVTEIDPGYDLPAHLIKHKPDVVFNALHGTYGEDGAIPGLLEAMKIPYTHSGVMSSALGFNKQKTKDILYHYGVKSPKGFTTDILTVKHSIESGNELINRPYVIKPLSQGSSVGVYILQEGTEVNLDDWSYGSEVMVEEYIPGMELTSAVLGDKALAVTELVMNQDGFYDYKAKYTANIVNHIIPARIPDEVYKKAMECAEIAHQVMECRTVSRSDFRYDPSKGDDGLYFLEINVHPGFTSLSLVPEQAKLNGISFDELVEKLILDARCDIAP